MPLPSGLRLGPYEVGGLLGAGGMGQVYKARDTVLHRDVAIKILPLSAADDAERLARFAREAQVLATLNHPHIAQIYAVVDLPQGSAALVMELVDGVDLAVRLGRGPVPLDEALPIVRQIVEALEYAHERGIIHRDLKPANVMLAADGTVKLLDFGLARLVTGGAPAATDAATFTSPAPTNLGLILGTAGYMSPEQAKGKPVDRRADIWAIGAILFEMLSGRRLYHGETVTDTIAQVITQPPDWTVLPAEIPASIRRLLRRCLEKEPRNRVQAAGDLRLEIDDHLAAPPESMMVTAVRPARWRTALPWGLAAASLAALLVVLLARGGRPVPARDAASVHVEARLGSADALFIDDNADAALAVLSPDGQTLAFVATAQKTQRHLWRRSLDALDATELAGTEGAAQQFFSPDGRWIGFVAGGILKKTRLAGGGVVVIAPAVSARGATWSGDDTIVFSPGVETGLSRVDAGGGTPVALTHLGAHERTHRWPMFLPDGKSVIFASIADVDYDEGTIEAVRLDTGARTVLAHRGTFPRYLASGHLVYSRGGTLFAVAFDPVTLAVTGEAQPVLAGFVSNTAKDSGNGASQLAFSDNGTVAYLPSQPDATVSQVALADRGGRVLRTFPDQRDFKDPRFSPDGSRLALQLREAGGASSSLQVLDLSAGRLSRITFDRSLNGLATWSRDGAQVAFYSDRTRRGSTNLFVMRSDGAGDTRPLTSGEAVQVASSFSPDGSQLAFMEQDLTSHFFHLFMLTMATREIVPLWPNTWQEMLPAFSPDGRWIAYQSEESGQPEIYVRAYPGPTGKWLVSKDGGAFPHWTRDGREIVYVAGLSPSRFMAADISVDKGVVHPGTAHQLFEAAVVRPPSGTFFDVTADGTRFALLQAESRPSSTGFTHVTLVFNFFSDVRRALAGGK